MQQIIVHCEEGYANVALFDEGRLTEYFVERPRGKQLVGNIYKGRVVNILPGMQAAFVHIGLEKNAFLYIDDVLPAHLEKVPAVKPSIVDVLREGQELIVQVAKEPLGTKGARVTTHISIPGRWIVYMPEADYVGVSRKVEPEDERNRLKEIGEQLRKSGEGLILRTVAQDEAASALEHDLNHLRSRWQTIQREAEHTKGVGEIYREQDMIERLVRDMFTAQVERLLIDDPVKGEVVKKYVSEVSTDFAERVHLYQDDISLVRRYKIDEELEKVFRPKIGLKSGGYMIIDRTEALTVVDINTGKFTGSNSLEETVFQTNLEAAEEIARILRLRDIGGIIIVDFIDMNEERHRTMIVEQLTEWMKKDRTKSLVVGWTRLGLLEITRKKVRENLDDLFFKKCVCCNGHGRNMTRHHPSYGQ